MKNINKCPFCEILDDEIYISNDYAIARFDKFPVNPGHLLIIPKIHISNYFDLEKTYKSACWDLIDLAKILLEKNFNPDGFNIGININEVSGQTIWHAHIHLIPRYKNDVDNPQGGVRGVIPSKKTY